MRIVIVGGKLQGLEATYLAHQAGWEVVLIDKDEATAASGLCDSFHRLDVRSDYDELVRIVQTVQLVELPLCIDSPDPKAIEAALVLCKHGQPMINSITDEQQRFKDILPLVLKYKAKIVALCMDDKGMPETGEDRTRVAGSLYTKLTEAGVPKEDIYFDPLVQPISSNDHAGIDVLDTIKLIKQQYPGAHMICGLSNVSYGLPNRKVLNRLFVVQTMVMGMDGYILNPTDKEMMGVIFASKALVGQDSYCMEYLGAHRKGLYGNA